MNDGGCYCSACRMPPCSWCTRSISEVDPEELAELYSNGTLDLPPQIELTPEQQAMFEIEDSP